MNETTLREELEKRAKGISECSDVMPDSLSEHKNRIYNACLDIVDIFMDKISQRDTALIEELEGKRPKKDYDGSDLNSACEKYHMGAQNWSEILRYEDGLNGGINIAIDVIKERNI